jgi:hypothetical protein
MAGQAQESVNLNRRAAREALYHRYCASVDNKAVSALTKLAA